MTLFLNKIVQRDRISNQFRKRCFDPIAKTLVAKFSPSLPFLSDLEFNRFFESFFRLDPNPAAVKSRRSHCGWHINYLLSRRNNEPDTRARINTGPAAAADNGCSGGALSVTGICYTIFVVYTRVIVARSTITWLLTELVALCLANLCLSRRSVRYLVECWGRVVIGVFWRKRKRRIRGFLEN